MIASGSIDGRPYCTSLVATALTQSVEPGIGTSSTLMPSLANQPILVAIANGAAADDTVRAHQATFTVVWASAVLANTPSAIAGNKIAARLIRLSLFKPKLCGFLLGGVVAELLRRVPEQH